MIDGTKTQDLDDAELTKQGKVVALYQFINDMNKLKQKAILNIDKYPWFLALSEIPDDPEHISVFYRDRVDDESANASDLLLSVHKPEFHRCPEPDVIFAKWLEDGWNSYKIPLARTKDTEHFDTHESQEEPERFTDNKQRIEAFSRWQVLRSEWVAQQKITERTRDLFTDLYRLYFELKRDSETMEMVISNGILCDSKNSELRHPVLTHRVKVNYDADKNTVSIEDTNVASELYTFAFQNIEGINTSAIGELSMNLQLNDYHPLDRNDTPGFLKVLVRQLSPESIFSDDGTPSNWNDADRLLLYLDPVYFVRNRLDGTVKAIEQIIDNVQNTGYVPAPIGDIVDGGTIEIPEDIGEESIEEQLAAVGGESVDILLSKEANKEQLEIAKRISCYNAVLVQGPPGTGKTHTIANLMGHFLAQGNSVLVTSQTPKALSVLKEKVAPGLQDLCVSILDDSNVDMERSIDGITGHMSKTTSFEVKRDMDEFAEERKDIIKQLAAVRRKIFTILNRECNCIVYNGEDISPSKAAEFVLNHTEDLSYIPGKVRLNYPLPLTFEQLTALYRSNEGLSVEDERELEADIPDTKQIMAPDEFTYTLESYQSALKRLEALKANNNWRITNLEDDRKLEFACPFGTFSVDCPSMEAVKDLNDYAASFGKIENWMKFAVVDGKSNGALRQKWITLIDKIQETRAYADSIVGEQFGHNIRFVSLDTITDLKETIASLKDIFTTKGKISRFTLMIHKEYGAALKAVTINGKRLQSAADCDIILHFIEMEDIRRQCSIYWNELLSDHDIPKFLELDTDHQENIANNFIPYIQKYLDWYTNNYQLLMDKLAACGLPADKIFSISTLDSDLIATDKILSAVEGIIPELCNAFEAVDKAKVQLGMLNHQKTALEAGKRGGSKYCIGVLNAINTSDTVAYAESYAALGAMYAKYKIQNDRIEMLKILEPVAPQWADAIRSRIGIHGEFTIPSTIEDAWKWKQLSSIIDDITAQPFCQLQADSLRLSKEYRRVTAEYAEKSGWYHLLRKTEADIDMKQALQGWKQTVKRIGKGTGKNAPMLKAEARKLMTKCQNAVPGWIMPINRALESLNPITNRFDIIIIDEASQSDISSLAILYMGKRLIIVGDDKQVSPMAVGVDVDEMNRLEQVYIKDKIPNSHLYNGKTSIYDIAATTFQPLMLREHFRCVPEIIGFSNMLSYDYKIKPLRDGSNSILLPAVVNYRVINGHREAKTNQNEARAVVALLQSCIKQPEYKGKTMGVISMLGVEQVKLIQKLIEEEIDPKEIVTRSIICGNSANFQGDERDVIILSVVDSGNGTGPIHIQNYGVDDAYRKRYNVAASRAKDQLWVVHSLDSAIDLKPGDIRKTLIDYASNPHTNELKRAEVEAKAESPFETSVASALVTRGYHIVQQWQVGAYRLDMVAVFKSKMIAIECDGERWHNSEAKIREDMERQTILERLGWRFIRIRGSEYYGQPEAVIDRVISELTTYGIEPEDTVSTTNESRNTELLNRVKNLASNILYGKEGIPDMSKDETIASALDTTKEIIEADVTYTHEAEVIKATLPATQEPCPTKKASNQIPKNGANTQSTDEKKPITKSVVPVKPLISETAPVRSSHPVQIALDGMDDLVPDADDIFSLLKQHNVPYLDKREHGGALWIIGGHELDDIVRKARHFGLNFKFKHEGGRATKGKPAWWTT